MVASPTRTMACTPRTSVDLRPIRRPSNRLSNCGKWSFPHAATGQSRGPAFSASGRRPAGWVSDQMITRSGAPNRGAASDLVVGRTSRKFPELPQYFPGHRHDSWRIRTTKSRFVTSRTLNTMARAATITLSFTAMHTGHARAINYNHHRYVHTGYAGPVSSLPTLGGTNSLGLHSIVTIATAAVNGDCWPTEPGGCE